MPPVERFKSYANRDDGAVTVDFVVLAAFALALGVGVLTTVSRGSLDFAGALDDHIKATEVGVGGGEGGASAGGADGAGAGVGSN